MLELAAGVASWAPMKPDSRAVWLDEMQMGLAGSEQKSLVEYPVSLLQQGVLSSASVPCILAPGQFEAGVECGSQLEGYLSS